MVCLWALSSLLAVLLQPALFQQLSELPKSWKVCKRLDPNLNQCLKGAISNAVKDLAQGNTRLGVPAIEPMFIDAITVDQGSGPVGIKLRFTKLFMYGLSKVIIDRVKADYSNYKYEIDFHLNGNLRIGADYVSSGRVLFIPINGVGKSNMTFEKFSGRVTLRGREQTRAGQTFLQIYKTDIAIDTTRLYINFRRTREEAISNLLNRFLNDNWRQILDDMRPAISQSFGANIQMVANGVFSKVPIDLIAPP